MVWQKGLQVSPLPLSSLAKDGGTGPERILRSRRLYLQSLIGAKQTYNGDTLVMLASDHKRPW